MTKSEASGSIVLRKAHLKDKETVSMQVNWMNIEADVHQDWSKQNELLCQS